MNAEELREILQEKGMDWLIAAMVDGSIGYHSPRSARKLIESALKGETKDACDRCIACYKGNLLDMIESDVRSMRFIEKHHPEKISRLIEIVQQLNQSHANRADGSEYDVSNNGDLRRAMIPIEIHLVVLVKAGITAKVEPFTDPINANARKQEILESEDYSDSEDSVEVFTVNIDAHPTITKAKREGIKRGIWLYAWTKDEVRMVGTKGINLKDALAEIDKMSDDEINTWF